MNIHTPAGLDAFVDELTDGPPVILADMGAGAGQVTYDWFDKMYSNVAEAGIAFTSVGVITADPASVESVLAWASRLARSNRLPDRRELHRRTHRLPVLARDATRRSCFSRRTRQPWCAMDFRLPVLENATRNHGVTLGAVAARLTAAPGVAEVIARDARAKLSQTACSPNSTRCRSCFCHERPGRTVDQTIR